MKSLMMIAKSNMKKRKTNIILIFVLTAIATMLLYTGLNVTTDVNKFLEKRNREQNGADAMFVCTEGYDDTIIDIFKSGKGYDYHEEEEALVMLSSKIKDISIDSKEESYSLLLYDINENRSISDLEIKGKKGKIKENSIVLPAYLNISCGYNVGDIVEISNGDKKYTFEIYGFSEDVMFSNPSNVTMFKIFINQNVYNKIKNEDLSALVQSSYNIKLQDGYSTKEFEEYVSARLTKEIEDINFNCNISINFETMKMGTSIFINIMMAIISVFAVIIVVISIIVIRFSINTTIESDMQNIGILEAVGYTSKQLKNANVIQYMFVSIVGAIFGIILSKFSAGIISKIVSSAIGLNWNAGTNLLLAAASFLAINIAILVVTNISTNKYKKITPLIALRSGIENHNFKKNYFPLDKTILGVNSTLGIKEILHNKKQNISMTVIVALLTFTCIVSIGIYYNFAVNPKALINIVGMENPNILITTVDSQANNDKEKIYNEISKRSDVENTLYYNEQRAILSNGENNISLNLEVISEIEKLKVNTIIEGREAKHDNEIMVTNVVLKNLNANLGDTIYVETLGERLDFIIVGVTQQIPQMGISAKISEEGMKRAFSEYKGTRLYVYLKPNINTEDVVKELSNKYKDSNISIRNFDELYNSVLSSFNGGVAILSVVCLVVTVLVVILILFMLIKLKLLKDRKTYGVYKALGYRSQEIKWQITMNFAPVIALGVLIGIILGIYFINPLFVLALSMAGIQKCSLTINPSICIAAFLFMFILTILISMISSRKVKYIEPCRIIME